MTPSRRHAHHRGRWGIINCSMNSIHREDPVRAWPHRCLPGKTCSSQRDRIHVVHERVSLHIHNHMSSETRGRDTSSWHYVLWLNGTSTQTTRYFHISSFPAPFFLFLHLYVVATQLHRTAEAVPLQKSLITMSSIVAQLDAGLSYAAKLVDRPEIDYESLVVYSGWAVTAFELYIL